MFKTPFKEILKRPYGLACYVTSATLARTKLAVNFVQGGYKTICGFVDANYEGMGAYGLDLDKLLMINTVVLLK